MANEQEKLLHQLEVGMKQLMFLCDSLRDENAQLANELEEKNKEIENLSAELSSMNLKHTNLKLAKSFSSRYGDEAKQARLKLSKLVQDVDKCISMLKE
ncbi:MAG: hypothetical protein ACK5MK_04450 [Dysgonomonas sp.]